METVKRPHKTDTEEDVLRMQNEYLKEKEKNPNFQPAAKVVRLTRPVDTGGDGGKKISAFAKSRKKPLELTDEKASEVKSKIMIGDVVERNQNSPSTSTSKMECDIEANSGQETFEGFPKILKIDKRIVRVPGRSLFAVQMEKKKQETKVVISSIENKDTNEEIMDTSTDESNTKDHQINEEVHQENTAKLQSMSEQEILAERNNLLKTLDPNMIALLKSRKKTSPAAVTNLNNKSSRVEEMPNIDILNDENATNWLNFNVIETDKLEWMNNISEHIPKLKPGEKYEARFDWKGYLLPYTVNDEDLDQRELYLHGDDVHRPGYTLQELFRLARSNVLQQRVSAVSAISGIISIYNQGYYDAVLDVPFSKIFFLMRFAFDENIPVILDVVSNALANIFYNDIDEILLDTIFESTRESEQPFFKQINPMQDVESKLGALNLDSNIATSVDDEALNDIAAMNDLHKAEVDLIECLVSTNILERIRYVLQIKDIAVTTKVSCLKILIRIARTSHDMAMRILSMDNLILSIQRATFTVAVDGYVALKMAFKLYRILSSVGTKCWSLLQSEAIEDKIKEIIFVRDDISMNSIQLQIECFRLIKVWTLISGKKEFLRSTLPALRFYMEYHFQFLDFHNSGHFMIRQHAAALIATLELLSALEFVQKFEPVFTDCFKKWAYLVAKSSHDAISEFSQTILLVACVRTSKHIYEMNQDAKLKSLDDNLTSKNLFQFFNNLSSKSILLSSDKDRSKINQALPNLGAVVSTKTNRMPALILKQNYPFILLSTLVETYPMALQQQSENVLNFFTTFIDSAVNSQLKLNGFVRFELKFLILFLKRYENCTPQSNEFILKLSFKLIDSLPGRYINEIKYILQYFIFSERFFEPNEIELLNLFKNDYLTLLNNTDKLDETGLPSYWPYLPLFVIYRASQNPELKITSQIAEDKLIKMTLQYTALIESKIATLLNPTDRLIYTMLPFFSSDAKFLEPDIKALLQNMTNKLRNCEFVFDTKLMDDKISFEVFYIAFLEQFQGMSYGDSMFGALLLAPLQQKYDAKWRKMVWSEHVAVLRFITCEENELIGGSGCLDDYLYPAETDESLLRNYYMALQSNLLRPDSIPHRIATHHVQTFLAKNKKM